MENTPPPPPPVLLGLTKNQNKFWNNLNDEERKAIVDLANDDSIIIKHADKGGSIVIMNSVIISMHVLIH